jgi:hypothetical protein
MSCVKQGPREKLIQYPLFAWVCLEGFISPQKYSAPTLRAEAHHSVIEFWLEP